MAFQYGTKACEYGRPQRRSIASQSAAHTSATKSPRHRPPRAPASAAAGR
ncbi:MAG TPA: hypothetical protein VHG91_01295 [Longimicrobium sp.]|nr:hypothetical protein [Longimicrobium sp.]